MTIADRIVGAVIARGKARPCVVARDLQLCPDSVRAHMSSLARRGRLRRCPGGYVLASSVAPVEPPRSMWTLEQIEADRRAEAAELGYLDLHCRLWLPGVE